ncbi:MAG: PLDc N-terminal domain-containing protein [Clostridia bacterium]|nr:PLDc N-terminal domain-containing protein [Clostridia bacterium]
MKENKRKRIEKYAAKSRRYKLLAYNRFFVVALAVLLQSALYFWMLFRLENQKSVAVDIIVQIIACGFVLYLVSRTERLSSRTHWIVLLLFAPIVGISLYLLFGGGIPTKRMAKKVLTEKAKTYESLVQSPTAMNAVKDCGRKGAICNYLSEFAHYPVSTDGTVDYYSSGETLFEEMLAVARTAKKFIFMEYFILAGGKMWDRLRELLVEKANEGVKVYIIYDDFGSILNLPYGYEKYLEELHPNIRCWVFNRVVPVFAGRMNNRDHRKIFVVDGEVAFTGGINIADEYVGERLRFGHWKDSGVKLTGSSVNSFTAMFIALWNAFRKDKISVEDCLLPVCGEEKTDGFFVQPYDDSPLDSLYTGSFVFLDMINTAKDYLYVFTPYLVLDDGLRSAFCAAAMRGVDVRIVTPSIPDKKMVFRLTRANYAALVRAGVKVYEYTPGFIHAKSMVSDGRAVVGSINCDYRSLYLHFENAVLFGGCEAVEKVKQDAEQTFALSKKMEKADLRRTPLGKLIDAFLRLFETML